MEKPVEGRQKEKFIKPDGLIGPSGAKAARKTGMQPTATAALRASVDNKLSSER